jgi:predicted nuclease of predicted toxin-antitoxin system
MRFLIDANLRRSAAGAIRLLGHEAVDVRDIGLSSAEDSIIAKRARADRSAILTRDFDFADVRNYPPEQFHGLVVLDVPDDMKADGIVRLVESFLEDPGFVSRVPGRLAVVGPGRVRFRPA